MPEASTSAISFDAAGLAGELEPLVNGLRAAIDAVKLAERQEAESLQVKQGAMAEHDLLIAACKSILFGFYLLARRPDLARRLRISLPRRRSRSRSGGTGDPPSEGAPEPSTDAEPAGGEPATG